MAEQTRRVGKNGYAEVALKVLVEGAEESFYIVISRGYFAEDGAKRWSKFITIPASRKNADWLIQAVDKVMENIHRG